ncbi:DUF3558 family protein [Gordonia terrae]
MRQALARDSRQLRKTAYAFAAIVTVAASGACTTEGLPESPPPAPSVSASSLAVRQTDDSGRRLPFETSFPNRWSINNDGSPYEPCTQIAPEVIQGSGLVVASVKDAAASDFQTIRGCEWAYLDDELSSLSQIVGNIIDPDAGLEGHKALNSAATEWFPDREIRNRRVLVGSITPSDCAVYVRSGDAVVVTSVTRFDIDRPSTERICDMAVEFLQATIDGIPK